MKKIINGTLIAIAMLAFMVGSATATKPTEPPSVPGRLPVNPNGFPSGPHYNLNIIAKPSHFECPPASEGNYFEITCQFGATR